MCPLCARHISECCKCMISLTCHSTTLRWAPLFILLHRWINCSTSPRVTQLMNEEPGCKPRQSCQILDCRKCWIWNCLLQWAHCQCAVDMATGFGDFSVRHFSVGFWTGEGVSTGVSLCGECWLYSSDAHVAVPANCAHLAGGVLQPQFQAPVPLLQGDALRHLEKGAAHLHPEHGASQPLPWPKVPAYRECRCSPFPY